MPGKPCARTIEIDDDRRTMTTTRRHSNARTGRARLTLRPLDDIAAWERAFLGAKGELTLFLRGLAALPADERPIAGRAATP